MSNLNDENSTTFTGVAAGATTGTLEVNSSDNGERLHAYVTEAGGGDPGDVTVVIERYSSLDDTWFEHQRTSLTSNTNERVVESDAVPDRMRVSLINDTSGGSDYDLNVVTD